MTVTRILITGSRHWTPDALYLRTVLAGLAAKHGPVLIVHGDCPTGVDRAFEVACQALGRPTERHPADWHRHGRAAGPRRNGEMVALGAAKCLAFHPSLDPKSGTADCVRQALRAGIPTWWIPNEDLLPIRQELTTSPAARGDFLFRE